MINFSAVLGFAWDDCFYMKELLPQKTDLVELLRIIWFLPKKNSGMGCLNRRFYCHFTASTRSFQVHGMCVGLDVKSSVTRSENTCSKHMGANLISSLSSPLMRMWQKYSTSMASISLGRGADQLASQQLLYHVVGPMGRTVLSCGGSMLMIWWTQSLPILRMILISLLKGKTLDEHLRACCSSSRLVCTIISKIHSRLSPCAGWK